MNSTVTGIQGNLLQLAAGRRIAVYQRRGMAWVADCQGGRWEVHIPGAWFAVNRRVSRFHALADEAVSTIPEAVCKELEALHRRIETAPANRAGAAAEFAARGLAALRSLVAGKVIAVGK